MAGRHSIQMNIDNEKIITQFFDNLDLKINNIESLISADKCDWIMFDTIRNELLDIKKDAEYLDIKYIYDVVNDILLLTDDIKYYDNLKIKFIDLKNVYHLIDQIRPKQNNITTEINIDGDNISGKIIKNNNLLIKKFIPLDKMQKDKDEVININSEVNNLSTDKESKNITPSLSSLLSKNNNIEKENQFIEIEKFVTKDLPSSQEPIVKNKKTSIITQSFTIDYLNSYYMNKNNYQYKWDKKYKPIYRRYNQYEFLMSNVPILSIKEMLLKYQIKLTEYIKALLPNKEININFNINGDGDYLNQLTTNHLISIKSIVDELVKNAAIHSIEKKNVRIHLGKNPIANINVEYGIRHKRDGEMHFVIIVSDDGTGFKLNLIKEVAIKHGLITLTEVRKTIIKENGLIYIKNDNGSYIDITLKFKAKS